ncbi:MAG: CoA-binding protein [Tissierellia bacterium]|nr:CoA-binding protein [Tissierellia bacterium]
MSIRQEMLDKKIWAVVGVSGKKEKWGYRLYNILKENDYKVYGVSPNYDEIEGDRVYHSLKDVPEKVDVINMVVSPRISINILGEANSLGIEYVFFQPGSYNNEVVAKAEELGLKYLIGDCVYAILKNRS